MLWTPFLPGQRDALPLPLNNHRDHLLLIVTTSHCGGDAAVCANANSTAPEESGFAFVLVLLYLDTTCAAKEFIMNGDVKTHSYIIRENGLLEEFEGIN